MPKSTEYSNSSTIGRKIAALLSYPLIFLIYVYRATLSPIFGNGCRFYPSCSHYTEDALKKYGAFKGSMMGAKRVLRCHPWHAGGYDPVE